MIVAWHVDFGQLFLKKKFEIKYEAYYCSEIQRQRFTADKLSCFFSNWNFLLNFTLFIYCLKVRCNCVICIIVPKFQHFSKIYLRIACTNQTSILLKVLHGFQVKKIWSYSLHFNCSWQLFVISYTEWKL